MKSSVVLDDISYCKVSRFNGYFHLCLMRRSGDLCAEQGQTSSRWSRIEEGEVHLCMRGTEETGSFRDSQYSALP